MVHGIEIEICLQHFFKHLSLFKSRQQAVVATAMMVAQRRVPVILPTQM